VVPKKLGGFGDQKDFDWPVGQNKKPLVALIPVRSSRLSKWETNLAQKFLVDARLSPKCGETANAVTTESIWAGRLQLIMALGG
jgi:hypothetical protein